MRPSSRDDSRRADDSEPEVEPSPEARLEAIYRSYSADVTTYALRRCDRDNAADVVSETFMVVWRRIGDVPDEPAVRPWLLGIARRVLANQRRGIRRRSALVDRAASYLVHHMRTVPAVDVDGDVEMVVDAMKRISPGDQEVLMLTAWEELSSSEIATVLGTSSSNARKRLFRARQRLESEVAKMNLEHSPESGHLLPRDTGNSGRQTKDLQSP